MIKINDKTYELSSDNYIRKYNSKTQIVIGNSFSEDMNHVKGWKTKNGGGFKRVSTYSIDIYGNIYQHYPPEFYSKYLDVSGIDEHIISISIENEGWLMKNIKEKTYTNYVGNIYMRKDGILKKKWRNHTYWAPYKPEQLIATLKLCKYLCKIFDIPQETISHNTKFDDIYDFKGIVYKSNYNKFYTDLSPAWDYAEFKNKLETN